MASKSASWHSLDPPLNKIILSVIENEFKFEKMTPVQKASIPLLMSYKDVAAEAVTGSGKTLAFVVPILELLLRRSNQEKWKSNEVGAIIISPTRELAAQTNVVLKSFAKALNFSHRLLIGGSDGASAEQDTKALKANGAQIIIATPGRLLELFERKCNLNLCGRCKSLEILVLDEADSLLQYSTKINTILKYLPTQRRTALFSATQKKEIQDLIRAGLRNPVLVRIREKATTSTPVRLQNYYMVVEPELKLASLLDFIERKHIEKALIFFPTCACVEYWNEVLPALLPKTKCLALHGKMKGGRFKVLQWEPPSNAAAFVHRVGRTARQGQHGNALILIQSCEDAYVDFLSRNQNVSLTKVTDIAPHEHLIEMAEKCRDTIHRIQLENRSIYDKSNRAFVSHIQAYSKHECNFLLRVNDLSLGKIASSYGLLKMPIMPELKQKSKDGKVVACDFIAPKMQFDINQIRYKNKQQEEARQKKLSILLETGKWPKGKNEKIFKKSTEAWSQSKQRKAEQKANKKTRKEKKVLKLSSGTAVKRKRGGFTEDDIAELANDIKMFKKLKKNKITDQDFDQQMGIES
ncbi:probable ATP-dependent RNA helicase DDX55 homolog isoform X2 [Contarinia nasturtii]|uniref:probable ATP-dependent RNA helicase DDX55 homolog isoform X2 n=1 Tax=Contarinia nasturtii TaxID=265458 RepID=UPI0012D49C81|nr:probable ATP-dependent RNA helicase DDX55 homolog isoform X2 [Contarinia nasturtii]